MRTSARRALWRTPAAWFLGSTLLRARSWCRLGPRGTYTVDVYLFRDGRFSAQSTLLYIDQTGLERRLIISLTVAAVVRLSTVLAAMLLGWLSSVVSAEERVVFTRVAHLVTRHAGTPPPHRPAARLSSAGREGAREQVRDRFVADIEAARHRRRTPHHTQAVPSEAKHAAQTAAHHAVAGRRCPAICRLGPPRVVAEDWPPMAISCKTCRQAGRRPGSWLPRSTPIARADERASVARSSSSRPPPAVAKRIAERDPAPARDRAAPPCAACRACQAVAGRRRAAPATNLRNGCRRRQRPPTATTAPAHRASRPPFTSANTSCT